MNLDELLAQVRLILDKLPFQCMAEIRPSLSSYDLIISHSSWSASTFIPVDCLNNGVTVVSWGGDRTMNGEYVRRLTRSLIVILIDKIIKP